MLPVVREIGFGVDLESPVFIGWNELELGLPFPKRHPGDPVGERCGPKIKGTVDRGIGLEFFLGVRCGVPEGPREEPQLEGSPVTHRTFVCDSPAHVRYHRGQVRWTERGHRGLGPTGPGRAPRAHLSVRPGLLVNPGERIESILGLGDEEVYVSFRLEGAPAVLDHGYVATFGEETIVARRFLGVFFAVGCSVEDNWMTSR